MDDSSSDLKTYDFFFVFVFGLKGTVESKRSKGGLSRLLSLPPFVCFLYSRGPVHVSRFRLQSVTAGHMDQACYKTKEKKGLLGYSFIVRNTRLSLQV